MHPEVHVLFSGSFSGFFSFRKNIIAVGVFFTILGCAAGTSAQSAYVRVNQAGYETGKNPFHALLMSASVEDGASFNVLASNGSTVYSASVGALVGNWATCTATSGGGRNQTCSTSVIYNVYALDFTVPGPDIYSISVSGPAMATSPSFAVNDPQALYSGLLLNTVFFYETQRDGPGFIPNALRSGPGHLKDKHASVYLTPPFDDNDEITSTGMPLTPTGAVIDGSGGWWDAGDYMKYVETVSYTTALMEIGIRDFPNQMGPNAPSFPSAPPASVSYAGNAAGAPASADFSTEAQFGIDWLMKMWDDDSQTLYYQVDDSQDWNNFPNLISEYDIWTLPQAADHYRQPGDPEACDPSTTFFICNRPVFIAAPAGSRISPNLAGRMAAAFAEYYQLNRTTQPGLANQALKNAEDIFALADTSHQDPSNHLLTIAPFDGYGETVWGDDMELGATELYFALKSAGSRANLPTGLRITNPTEYLRDAARIANRYINDIYDTGNSDTLNLYDLSGLAHFELYRALGMAGKSTGLAVSQSTLLGVITGQVNNAIAHSGSDAFGFGTDWRNGDTTSHGAGLSVMASEAQYLTHSGRYNNYSKQWLGNILGVNSWGSSFIVGDGSTFPNCIQHQVANLAGALNGTAGGTPILWGAASEGPSDSATTGTLDHMRRCPRDGIDTFAIFNGVDGTQAKAHQAVYRDNVQSYSTTEPAIDLTSTSFLMFSWRMAHHPSFWTNASLAAYPQSISRSANATTMLVAVVDTTGSEGPQGKVQFYLNGTGGLLLGEAQLTAVSPSTSRASLNISTDQLVDGANKILVYFAGDAKNDGPSTSLRVRVSVKK
jgi:endoglucanase